MYPTITLKAGRGNPLVTRHPWIFTGAISSIPAGVKHGDIVRVATLDDEPVGTGFYSNKSMIAVRLVDFGSPELDRNWLKRSILAAERHRRLMGLSVENAGGPAYRMVFGESDWLPGLVVDRYGDILVVQISTAGMERLREDIVTTLVELFSPHAVYERSDSPSRTEESLEPKSGTLFGPVPTQAPFHEGPVLFAADIVEGQKTGFFLDQRRLRDRVRSLAASRKVLDLFSYTGASGISALMGEATHATFVDSSATALTGVHRHAEMNGFKSDRFSVEEADVFQWLGTRETPEYEMVLLDPPALIKSRKHAESGRKGYHFLNRAALRLVKDGGILVSSSCSAHFSEDDLRVTLRRAAEQAGARLHVLDTVSQAEDHPVSLYFPEARYLKSFICLVER